MSMLAHSLCSKLSKGVRHVSLLNKTLSIMATRTFSVSFPKLDDYRAELTAKQINNDNPFDTYVLKPEAGRGLFEATPVLIPSISETRWVCYINRPLFITIELQNGWMLLRG